jgi:Zn-dependent M28 family amino/carboxypeptidase
MKSKVKVRILISIAFLTASCFMLCLHIKKVNESAEKVAEVETPAEVKPTVNIPTIENVVTTLCSDELEGRRVFSKGNEKAAEYIANIFKNIGLNPVFEDSYFQEYKQEFSYPTAKEGKENSGNSYGSYKTVHNVVGYISGTDSEKAVVISAHFDHIGIKDGNIYRGALDNASGVAALIEIAKKLKEASEVCPFKTNIIFCAFNGEEQLYKGSTAFVEQSKSKPWYNNMYNINIDCIGAKDGGKLAYANADEYSKKLYDDVKSIMNKNNIDFDEIRKMVGSDHRSFELIKKPNICICQEKMIGLTHKPTDIPDILDYKQIEKIADALCDFIESNDGIVY